jgi:hypothetical protein
MEPSKATENIERVLQSISAKKPSPLSTDELMRAVEQAGVSDVRDLVRRVVEARNKRLSANFTTLAGQVLGHREPSTENAKIIHRPPSLAFFVDGVAYDPSKISSFNGRPLHFMLVGSEIKGHTLLAFTTDECLNGIKQQYIASLTRADYGMPGQGGGIPLPSCPGGRYPPCPTMGGPPSSPPPPPFNRGQIQMFSDSDYGGDWFWLRAGTAYHALYDVDRNTVLWWSSNWDDTISSLAGTDGTVTYYEHPGYAGSSLTIAANDPVSNLADLGWNDRISSVANWGTTITAVVNWG